MRAFFTSFVLFGLIACLGSASAANVTLDLRTSGRAEMGARLLAVPATQSCLRASAFAAGATVTAPLSVGDTLDFLLFENTAFQVTLIERMESPLGGEAFIGTVSGYNGVRNAVILQTAEGLTADIQDFARSRTYSIVSDENGVTVKEIDPSAEIVTPTVPIAPRIPAASSPRNCSPTKPPPS